MYGLNVFPSLNADAVEPSTQWTKAALLAMNRDRSWYYRGMVLVEADETRANIGLKTDESPIQYRELGMYSIRFREDDCT